MGRTTPPRPDTSSTMETFTQKEKRLEMENIDVFLNKKVVYSGDVNMITAEDIIKKLGLEQPKFPKDRKDYTKFSFNWNTILISLVGSFIIYLVIIL